MSKTTVNIESNENPTESVGEDLVSPKFLAQVLFWGWVLHVLVLEAIKN